MPALRRPDHLVSLEFETFDEFAASLAHEEYDSKDAAALIIPVAEWVRPYRENENARTMSRVFFLDFDRVTDTELDQIIESARGMSAVIYSSYSHGIKPGHCFRLVVELENEYPAAEHRELWQSFQNRFPWMDKATKDPARAYYIPSKPPGRPGIVERLVGSPQSTRPARNVTAPAVALRGASPAPTLGKLAPEVIAATVSAWGRYRGQDPDKIERAALAKKARLILDGKDPEIPAGEGRRHPFMLTLAGMLAASFPDYEGESIAAAFDGIGWDHFAAGDLQDHGIDRFARMICDFQAKTRQENAAREAQRQEAQQKAIVQASGGTRDYPITEEELAALVAAHGPNWRAQAVVQYQSGFVFMNPDGHYGKRIYSAQELMDAAKHHFALFAGHVSIYTETDTGGLRPMSPAQFAREYVSVAKDFYYDMSVERSTYYAAEQRMVMSCAVPRVEPIYHEEIHRWLHLVGGDLLIDWAAGCSRLNQMLPALVLVGPPSAGKTLFAYGCARIWGAGPNADHDVHTRFSATALKEQPIVFHDEKAGEAYEKHGTSLVRRFVTEGVRRAEEKYLPKVVIKGYPRLIFAANDMDVLNTREEINDAGTEALAERLLHIQVTEEAAAFGRANKEQISESWLGNDLLAQHIYWLGKNWEIKNKGDRFLVKVPRTELHRGLAGKTGYTGEIVQWILDFVLNPDPVLRAAPAEIKDGKIRLTSLAISKHWDAYKEGDRKPTRTQIGKALRGVSSRGRQKITIAGPKGAKSYDAYEITIEDLEPYLESHDSSREEFYLALGLAVPQ